MDEIKETQKDSPQELGKAPEGSEETTPKDQAKTYTEKEIEEIKAKAAQDARVTAGRDAKTLSDWEASLKTQQQEMDDTKSEISKMQEQIDQAELEAARGDPVKLRELQAKKSYKTLLADLEGKKKELKKERDNFERDKAEHASKIKAAEETQLEIEIWKIANTESVDPVELKDTMKDLKLTTVEQAKTVAKRLNKKPKDETPVKKSTHDSLVTSGPKGSQEGKTARQIYADGFREKKK